MYWLKRLHYLHPLFTGPETHTPGMPLEQPHLRLCISTLLLNYLIAFIWSVRSSSRFASGTDAERSPGLLIQMSRIDNGTASMTGNMTKGRSSGDLFGRLPGRIISSVEVDEQSQEQRVECCIEQHCTKSRAVPPAELQHPEGHRGCKAARHSIRHPMFARWSWDKKEGSGIIEVHSGVGVTSAARWLSRGRLGSSDRAHSAKK